MIVIERKHFTQTFLFDTFTFLNSSLQIYRILKVHLSYELRAFNDSGQL